MGAGYYGFSDLAWRPGTETIAASTGFNENGDLRTWMLDLTHDSATPLTVTGYPMAWVPNDGPLILSSDFESVIGGGRYIIQAARCAASGQCAATTLTTVAYHYNFLGLVRTA